MGLADGMAWEKEYGIEPKQEPTELLNCPHCGGKAILYKESKQYTKRLNKKVQYSRIVCINNNPHDQSGNRCLCKTVAAPTEEVVKHWNTRALKE